MLKRSLNNLHFFWYRRLVFFSCGVCGSGCIGEIPQASLFIFPEDQPSFAHHSAETQKGILDLAESHLPTVMFSAPSP